MEINIGIDRKERSEITAGLSRLLADSYTLYLKTHNYHWNVEGPMFQTLHTMFETQYTELALAVDLIAERFEALYEKRYGIRRSGKPITLVALRVASLGGVPSLVLPEAVSRGRTPEPVSRRSLYWAGEWHFDCPVFERAGLGRDMRFSGPAIVEEYGSTTVVLPGWEATVDALGNIALESAGEST